MCMNLAGPVWGKVKEADTIRYIYQYFLFVEVICMLVVEVICMCYLLFNLEFEGIIC